MRVDFFQSLLILNNGQSLNNGTQKGGVMNKREQQKEQTLNEILQVSERLFHEKGYENTSIQNIADSCGLSKGALYHHFKSKEEVLERICLNFYQFMKKTFIPVTEKEGISMSEKIKEIMTMVRSSEMNQASVTFASDLPETHISTANAAMEKLFDYYSEKIYIEVFSPLFEQGRTEGECSFTGSPENMALFIHHLDSGMMNQVRRIIRSGKNNAVSELEELIGGFTSSVSRLLSMTQKAVEEMVLTGRMLENYKAVIKSDHNNSHE